MADRTMNQTLRSALSSLAWCFRRGDRESNSPTKNTEIVPSSSSGWLMSSAEMLPQKWRNLMWRGRRGGGTADFRYDPLSYAMNFEDEKGGGGVDESSSSLGFRNMGFVARLPPSPLPEANGSSGIERS
uniref:Uncharacterized protein n=1 Tax=Kalanchoe fedtschenkoi TaxID=63787 RepID=A0A7N0T8X5_KALFE